jgi:hypothetical protein
MTVEAWMDGWMDGWMDREMEREIDTFTLTSFLLAVQFACQVG